MLKDPRARRFGGTRGAVLVIALLVIVVLSLLGVTFLTIAVTENQIAFNEEEAVQAFYAADAGMQEALIRLNLDTAVNSDEVDTPYDTTSCTPNCNPASVQDPRMVNNQDPIANPKDSAFWHYDPNWSYKGGGNDGEGNPPGAGASQKYNLDDAGRRFTYDSSSSRTLTDGAGYTVTVTPIVKKISGTWRFVDELGNAAPANTYYYKVTSLGTAGGAQKEIRAIVKKFWFNSTVPAPLAAAGAVNVGGNASIDMGDNPYGVAIQSASTVTQSGSATINGTINENTAFPGFEALFGMTKSEMESRADLTYTMTGNISNPSEIPDGTVGKLIWVKGSSYKLTLNSGFTLGSETEPVILVVEGDLTLNSVNIYGIIYVMETFRNQGKSSLKGGILVEGTAETDILGTGEGSKIIYQQSVIDQLNKNPNMFPFELVKGTWHES